MLGAKKQMPIHMRISFSFTLSEIACRLPGFQRGKDRITIISKSIGVSSPGNITSMLILTLMVGFQKSCHKHLKYSLDSQDEILSKCIKIAFTDILYQKIFLGEDPQSPLNKMDILPSPTHESDTKGTPTTFHGCTTSQKPTTAPAECA